MVSNETVALTYELPSCVVQCLPGAWQICGTGVFSWSVFKLYRASLHARGDFAPDQPFALDLAYLRNISAEQIVSTSIQEIERICALDPVRLKDWAVALLKILPDVSLGDHLVGLFLPRQGVKFFSEKDFLGEILDAEFVTAFAAIWLDEQTRSPALRKALLGDLQ